MITNLKCIYRFDSYRAVNTPCDGYTTHLANGALENRGKVHPCTGTEALYRPYGQQGEQRYRSTLS